MPYNFYLLLIVFPRMSVLHITFRRTTWKSNSRQGGFQRGVPGKSNLVGKPKIIETRIRCFVPLERSVAKVYELILLGNNMSFCGVHF